MEPRRIVFAVFPDFQILALDRAVRGVCSGQPAGQWVPLDTVAVRPGPASSSGGLAVTANPADDGPVDALVGSGTGTAGACAGTAFVAWVTAAAGRGAETAHIITRQLVMFVQRPGGQIQLAGQRPHCDALADIRSWIVNYLADNLTVPALAARAS